METINLLSTLDDLMVIGGIFLIAYGEGMLGVLLIFGGLAIMFGKGEIGVPIG